MVATTWIRRIVCVFCIFANLSCFYIVKTGNFRFFNLGVAGFILALNIISEYNMWRVAQLRREIAEMQAEMLEAHNRYAENLKKVVAVVGAEPWRCGFKFKAKNGEEFWIDDGSIVSTRLGDSTCYQSHTMPTEEKIASAMLLLYNDPTLFEKWAYQRGQWWI